MRIMNWTSVEESTPFEKLPAGAYVITITDVEDVPDREYLNIVFDIKEGEFAGFYSDDFARKNPWAHRFVRSYKESAQGMFKAFLSRLEESNRSFTVEKWQQGCLEADLLGLELGIVLQTEYYTNDHGEDKERLTCVGVYASQDIRNGGYKMPAPKDARKKVEGLESPIGSDSYSDVPF